MDTEFAWWMQLLLAAATAGGGWLMSKLTRLMDGWFSYIAQKTRLALADEVDEFLMGWVVATYNAEVEHAKAASADGKLTAEEKAYFLQIPIDKAKEHFSISKLAGLATSTLQDYLVSRTEKAVTIAKQAGAESKAAATANPT